MNLFNENKSFNLILLIYFASLPLVFFSSILDPFLLSRQIVTNIFLLFIIIFILKNDRAKYLFTLDITSLLFLGFVFFCGLSFLQSQLLDISHTDFSKYLTYLAFFLLTKFLITNNLIKNTQLYFYVIVFGIVSLFIIVLAFTNKAINGKNLFNYINLMTGTFGNKNFLSSILFICLPFYFIGVSKSKKIKIVSISAIVLTIIFLLLLRTRTVIIVLFLFLFLILCRYIKNKFSKKTFTIFLFSLVSIVVIIIYYFFSIKNQSHSSTDIITQYFIKLLSSNTFYERLEFWQQATYTIKDNFFNGVGIGNWIITYPKYGLDHFSKIDIQNGKMLINSPHNDYLLVLLETGVFGFLFYLGIFISILYQAYWLSINEFVSSDRKNASYFLFFIICYLIIAFFDFPLARIEHQIILMVVFSIINSQYLKVNQPKGIKIFSRYFFIFCSVILIYSSTILFYRINGERHLFKALEAENKGDSKTALFELNKAKNPYFSTDNFALPLDWHIGKTYYNDGRFKESLYSFINAYTINPNSIVVNNDLGSSYIKNENVINGIIHYKKALNISPNYEDARLNLAATYYNIGEFENAFVTINQCNSNSQNAFYKQILTPIVEKKLNLTLERLNNTNLNSYLKSKIKTENDLLTFYFEYKKNNITFDRYVKTLIN